MYVVKSVIDYSGVLDSQGRKKLRSSQGMLETCALVLGLCPEVRGNARLIMQYFRGRRGAGKIAGSFLGVFTARRGFCILSLLSHQKYLPLGELGGGGGRRWCRSG